MRKSVFTADVFLREATQALYAAANRALVLRSGADGVSDSLATGI